MAKPSPTMAPPATVSKSSEYFPLVSVAAHTLQAVKAQALWTISPMSQTPVNTPSSRCMEDTSVMDIRA